MENQEYLNQIAAQARPTETPGRGGIFKSKLFLGLVAVIGVLTVVMIVVAIISGNKSAGPDELGFSLQMHIEGTSSIINKYQPLVKSSVLRSSSASLNTILSDTNAGLTNYLSGLSSKSKVENLRVAADTARDELDQELFAAKINGNLDRVYAHKMTYEIELLAAEENKLINLTKSDKLKELLTKSYSSLETLYDQFNDFSEAK